MIKDTIDKVPMKISANGNFSVKSSDVLRSKQAKKQLQAMKRWIDAELRRKDGAND